MRKQFHFRPSPDGLYAWDVERLVGLADGTPAELIALNDLAEIDEDWWYAHESEPTIRSIVEHVRLIGDVNLAYPIIVDPDGRLMDGMHRVAKALLLDRTTVEAMRLPVFPEPDHTDHKTDDPPKPLGPALMTKALTSAGREMHSRPVSTGRGFWWTDNLWSAAERLTPFETAIDQIPEFDMNCWFTERTPPTCRAITEHARRIQAADLTYPVILAADGGLMDGGHRLAKACLNGLSHVAAVRFDQDPEPDWVEPAAR